MSRELNITMEIARSPLVSIIVPAFNVSKYIERCLRSIIKQKYSSIEIIVVNDCSTDNTASSLDELSKEDDRIVVVHLEQNVGVHAARSQGINLACGDFIGFVDGDDWISPGMYEDLVKKQKDNNADIVICGADKISRDEKFLGSKVKFKAFKKYDENILELFCRRKFASGVLWNKIYRASLIKKYGTTLPKRKLYASEDYVVNIGCFSEAKCIVTIPDKYYYYLIRADSTTRIEDNGQNFVRVLWAYISCIEIYAKFTEEQLENIDMLFARLLKSVDYQVPSSSYLVSYEYDLKCILKRLAEIRPKAFYTLVNSNVEKVGFFRKNFRKFYILSFNFIRAIKATPVN